jgi:hypothetical protein
MQRLLLALTALTAIACNVSTDGANGNVTFTPTDCGRIGCDFDNSMGVGGTIQVQIAGIEGVSTAGADLISDDPSLLSVTAVADVGQPTWELQSLAPGVARLTVLDSQGADLDFLEVPMQELTGLIGTNILGDAVGPSDDASFDEVWTVNADEAVSFQVTPVIGIDSPTMGKYVYTATVDAGLEAGLIDTNLSEGYLYFEVPAGQYTASFEDDFGHFIDMLIIAE